MPIINWYILECCIMQLHPKNISLNDIEKIPQFDYLAKKLK